MIFFGVASPSFVSWGNLHNILVQVSVTAIMATGLTFVLLTGEMDLSFANVANAAGVIVAYFTVQDASVNIANIPLPGGAAICHRDPGGADLRRRQRLRHHPHRHSLLHHDAGDAGDIGGVCAILVRGQIAYRVPDLIQTLGASSIGPLPWLVIVAAVILAIGHFVLTYTRFGRYVYMVGGNREAAEYAGINVRMILAAVMVISSVCAGIAGMLGVAHFGSAQQDEFGDFLIDGIAAVVVGGTSLFGGQGSIGNTIVGLFVLAVLNNGLDHISIDSFVKVLIRGLILLAALIINVYAQRLRTRGQSAT